MKKLFIALIILLLPSLCSCGRRSPEETTTIRSSENTAQVSGTETTIKETSAETTAIKTMTEKAVTNRYGQTTVRYRQTTVKAKNENTVTNPYGQAIVEIETDKSDPYSYVIKESYDHLNDGHEGYASLQFYSFYDVDSNGTKELLLGAKESYGICIYAIYAIRNGVAVKQDQFFLISDELPSLLFKNGTIRSDHNDEGDLYYCYYQFEKEKLKFQTTLIDYDGQHYRDNTYKGSSLGTPITKQEFERVKKEFEGNGQVVELDWKPLAEYKG